MACSAELVRAAASRLRRAVVLHRIKQQHDVVLGFECVLDGGSHLLMRLGSHPFLPQLLALVSQLETVIHAAGRCT